MAESMLHLVTTAPFRGHPLLIHGFSVGMATKGGMTMQSNAPKSKGTFFFLKRYIYI